MKAYRFSSFDIFCVLLAFCKLCIWMAFVLHLAVWALTVFAKVAAWGVTSVVFVMIDYSTFCSSREVVGEEPMLGLKLLKLDDSFIICLSRSASCGWDGFLFSKHCLATVWIFSGPFLYCLGASFHFCIGFIFFTLQWPFSSTSRRRIMSCRISTYCIPWSEWMRTYLFVLKSSSTSLNSPQWRIVCAVYSYNL